MKIAAYDADGRTMIGRVDADGVVTPLDEIEGFCQPNVDLSPPARSSPKPICG